MDTVSFTSYNFALFMMYLILVLFIALQLFRIAYYRHKLRSFQVGFLLQCFLLCLFRAFFFLFVDQLSRITWLDLFLYWVPPNIQYSTFTLLVVYYANLEFHHKSDRKKFKRKYILLWAITNSILFLLAAVWITLGIALDDPSDPEWLSRIHGYFTGTIFLLLVVMLSWRGWRLFLLIKKGEHPTLESKVSFTKIAVVTFFLFLSFTSRCVFNFVTSIGALATHVASGTGWDALVTLLAFTIWEVLPTILVLVLFGNVSATNLGAFSKQAPFPREVPYIRVDNPSGRFPSTPLASPQAYYESQDSSPARQPFLTYGTINSPYNTVGSIGNSPNV